MGCLVFWIFVCGKGVVFCGEGLDDSLVSFCTCFFALFCYNAVKAKSAHHLGNATSRNQDDVGGMDGSS